jgi:fumarate reductase flavoprotein subunit
MKEHIDRRAFLTGVLGVGTVTALGAVVGCTSNGADSSKDSGKEPKSETANDATTDVGLGPASETVETDVLVVGAGAAGMLAAYEAAKAGAKVTVISNSPDANSTNGSMVSGTSAVDTKYIREFGQTDVTTDDLFQVIYRFTHGMVNARLLKTCIAMQPGTIDIFDEIGIAMSVGVDRYDIGLVNVHLFGTEGKGQIIEDHISSTFGAEFSYDTEAEEPIMENNACVGIKAKRGDVVVDYRAKAVVLACGGYLSDTQALKEKHGCDIVQLSSPYQTGKGIKIAETAGAHRESIDTLGLSDVVGANLKNGFNLFNPVCMPAMYGGLLVAPDGRRFMNEDDLAMASMSYGGEPLLHVKQYYAVLDEEAIQSITAEGGYYAYMGSPPHWVSGMVLYSRPIEGFEDAFDQAISDGWVTKFDSVAKAASELGLTDLEKTVTDYNAFCASGEDTEFFKDPSMLKAVDTSKPIYIIQYNPGAFNTAGGCRTDDYCRALTAEFEPIDGLYIAGVENGSLYGRPYCIVGGNMSGLAYSSGRLAGQQAAAFAKK